MPSPYHQCSHPGCEKLVNPRAQFCRSHYKRTREHIENQAATQRGKKLSAETKAKISATRSGRVEAICLQCGKSFKVKPYHLNKGEGKFCSSQCAYIARSGENSPYWQGGPVKLQCALCHKDIERTPALIKLRRNMFCSLSCRSLYNKAHQKNKGTKIERIMKAALISANLSFSEQVVLCNVSVADFYSEEYNIAIYCDGDYWHRLPRHVESDARQTGILEANGVIVLRFWEKDIENDIDGCISHIKDIIVRQQLDS
jgi:Uncharacterized protein conserved in bacteria